MKFYYRLSDHGYPKQKLPGTSKTACLRNFLECFGTDNVLIIADNLDQPETDALLNGRNVMRTELGNAGSLWYALERAVAEAEDCVYFVEDDYLHQPDCLPLLTQGLQLADYCTLYDHPDKYLGGYNFGETCKVYKTDNHHFRTTASTCMTFGANVAALRNDMNIWRKYTTGHCPDDHGVFTALGEAGRRLVVPIPGAAVHTDLTFSITQKSVTIEPWAITWAIRSIRQELRERHDAGIDGFLDGIIGETDDWTELLLLEALRVSTEKVLGR